jgi:predicted Zn-dependent protease
VTGQVDLDAPELEEMLDDGDSDEVRAVIMHELGHVLGLAHVGSPFELMYETSMGINQYGPGDREGLARLGRAACD